MASNSLRVLSLFDGMACGRLALERAGLPVAKYFASEIDPYAMKVAKRHWGSRVQHVGAVETVHGKLGKIDLLLGGSPCQGFSRAGDGFGFSDSKSRLFFEYLRLLKEYRPKWFFLENVEMDERSVKRISQELGVEPTLIDSARVSAQTRKRLYWTNIPFEVPEDKHILLEDVLDDRPFPIENTYTRVFRGNQFFEYPNKPIQIGEADGVKGHSILRRVYSPKGKCPTLVASGGGGQVKKIGANGRWREITPVEGERLQTVPDYYTNCVSKKQRHRMLGNGWTVDVIAHILRGIENEEI